MRLLKLLRSSTHSSKYLRATAAIHSRTRKLSFTKQSLTKGFLLLFRLTWRMGGMLPHSRQFQDLETLRHSNPMGDLRAFGCATWELTGSLTFLFQDSMMIFARGLILRQELRLTS